MSRSADFGQRVTHLVQRGMENPREIPPYVLKKGLGLEPWKFGRHAIPNAVSKSVYRRVSSGRPERLIWDEDWDLLLLVDSCRPEWMREVSEEYDWIDDVGTARSPGSHSREWIANTFTEEYRDEIQDTMYVTGNPYSRNAPCDDFAVYQDLHEVEWSVESPVPPAHVVTDHTIELTRDEDWDRCIAHYMQPHKPIFRSDAPRREPRLDERWQPDRTFWRQYIDGHVSRDELESAFVSNLRYVLDEIAVLLENVDAPSVVITSDHGQAMGEHYLWSHREGVQHPSMRRVPWIECTATDTNSVEPATYERGEYGEEQRRKQLEQLGYL